MESSDSYSPDTLKCREHAADDTTLVLRPLRQVDYLSHDWSEENVWTSWRHAVNRKKRLRRKAVRRKEFVVAARLENASWRAWIKAKNNLRVVSPGTLDWYVEKKKKPRDMI